MSSPGTIDAEGVPALKGARTLGAALGVDLSTHHSRRLSSSQVAEADLVLGFEQIHLRHAVVCAAANRRRTFTLEELVRVLQHVSDPPGGSPPELARRRVSAAYRLRSIEPDAGTERDEIADPFGRKRKGCHRRTAGRVHGHLLGLSRACSSSTGSAPSRDRVRRT